MPTQQIFIRLLWCMSVFSAIPGMAQSHTAILKFHTRKGREISVEKGSILVNGKVLYRMEEDEIIYDSKRNRLIEDGGAIFLFLEIDGRPNLDRLHAFQITENRVELVANAISSDLTDFDGDSFLEFGGCDLTEQHPSDDSMYYIPFHYYEIRNGRIGYDAALSKKMDVQTNGVYLANPIDNRVVGCCTVIVKPGLKKVLLVNPLIISERIDGPANVRDTVLGRQLFVLNDNIAVSSSDVVNGWCRVGLIVDLNDSQYVAGKIRKGAKIFVAGLVVGNAVDDVSLGEVFKGRGKKEGVLMGYTAIRNIKDLTLPENVLAKMIDQNARENIGMARLKDFIKGFQLSKGLIGSYVTYQLDEGVVFGPSSPLRLLLVFNGEELFAVVHRRKLPIKDSSVDVLHRGYLLSVIASPSLDYTAAFIKQLNKWIDLAD